MKGQQRDSSSAKNANFLDEDPQRPTTEQLRPSKDSTARIRAVAHKPNPDTASFSRPLAQYAPRVEDIFPDEKNSESGKPSLNSSDFANANSNPEGPGKMEELSPTINDVPHVPGSSPVICSETEVSGNIANFANPASMKNANFAMNLSKSDIEKLGDGSFKAGVFGRKIPQKNDYSSQLNAPEKSLQESKETAIPQEIQTSVKTRLDQSVAQGLQLYKMKMAELIDGKVPITDRQIQKHCIALMKATLQAFDDSYAPILNSNSEQMTELVKESRKTLESEMEKLIPGCIHKFNNVIEGILQQLKKLTSLQENKFYDLLDELDLEKMTPEDISRQCNARKEEVLQEFRDLIKHEKIEYEEWIGKELEQKIQDRIQETIEQANEDNKSPAIPANLPEVPGQSTKSALPVPERADNSKFLEKIELLKNHYEQKLLMLEKKFYQTKSSDNPENLQINQRLKDLENGQKILESNFQQNIQSLKNENEGLQRFIKVQGDQIKILMSQLELLKTHLHPRETPGETQDKSDSLENPEISVTKSVQSEMPDKSALEMTNTTIQAEMLTKPAKTEMPDKPLIKKRSMKPAQTDIPSKPAQIETPISTPILTKTPNSPVQTETSKPTDMEMSKKPVKAPSKPTQIEIQSKAVSITKNAPGGAISRNDSFRAKFQSKKEAERQGEINPKITKPAEDVPAGAKLGQQSRAQPTSPFPARQSVAALASMYAGKTLTPSPMKLALTAKSPGRTGITPMAGRTIPGKDNSKLSPLPALTITGKAPIARTSSNSSGVSGQFTKSFKTQSNIDLTSQTAISATNSLTAYPSKSAMKIRGSKGGSPTKKVTFTVSQSCTNLPGLEAVKEPSAMERLKKLLESFPPESAPGVQTKEDREIILLATPTADSSSSSTC